MSASAALASTHGTQLSVTSTLDHKTSLPHQVDWVATPSVPQAQVSRVDFLIDGKVHWTAHTAPYTYGDANNWLVTSWLTPGMHSFTTKVTTTSGSTAVDTVHAKVLPTPAPPSALRGTHWKRTFKAGQIGEAPAGVWELTIGASGWKIKDPQRGGAYIDVAYHAPNTVQSRSGIWTRNPTVAEKAGKAAQVQEGNGWCPDTNVPVNYHWAVTSTTLTLTLAGGDRCGDGSHGRDEDNVWAGTWTRVK